MALTGNEPNYALAQQVSAQTGLPVEWVWAQWAHESGNFTSQVYREFNNPGGLKQFKANPEGVDAVSPEGDNYQVFGSLQEYADYMGQTYLPAYRENGLFDAQNIDEYAAALKNGGYYGDSVENYSNGMKSFLNPDGYSPTDGMFHTGKDAYNAPEPIVPTVEPIAKTRWQESKDKFQDAFFDSGFGSYLRGLWTNLQVSQKDSNGQIFPQGWRASEKDVDYVTKSLPNDPVAQKFALLNARSPEHLMVLVEQKKDDENRKRRVASYGWGLSSAATLAGILANPINLIPIGMEATGIKLLSRLAAGNRVVQALNTSKIAKYAEIGAQNSALAVGNAYGAEKLGGFQQDYTHTALGGAIAGAGLSYLFHFIKGPHTGGKDVQNVINAFDNMETTAITKAADLLAPNEIHPNTKGLVAAIHDPDFHISLGSELLSKLTADGKVFSVGKKEIRGLAQKLGVELPDNVKAFHVPNENYTVIVKDNIKPTDNIDSILAHEIGVHGGLKSIINEKAYSDILAAVEKRVKNPQGEWKAAVKATPGGGLEEVLGHFIERTAPNKDNQLFNKLKANVNKGLRALGLDKDLSDTELKDFVRRALKNEVDNKNGFRTLSDGTAVWGNLKYSAANLFNPNNMEHYFTLPSEVTKQTQKDMPSWVPKWFSKFLEAGTGPGTIAGILGNSMSPLLRKLNSTLHIDARMRGATENGLVIPVEKMKEHIKNQLNTHWANYMDIRNEHVNSLGNSVRQEFNSQVREAYNALYTNSDNGIVKGNWHPDVIKAVKIIKDLRDDIVSYGKKSSEMFGTDSKNLIDKDWTPLDNELWRVLDEDKWVSFMDKFPSMKDAQDWLAQYAISNVKKDIMEQRLLNKLTQEWEVEHAQWEKDHIQYKKDLDNYEAKVEAIKAKDEDRYQKILDKWKEKVSKWEAKVASLPKKATKPAKPLKPQRPGATPKPMAPKIPKEREKPTEVSPEELDNYITQEAHGWANGIVDRDNSNLDHPKSSDNLNFFRERLPMDTTGIRETPWGEQFSFDTHLRSDNFDHIIPKVIDRVSGEMAFRNAFSTPEAWEKTYKTIESQLDHAVQHNQMTPAQRSKELNTLSDAVALLRGVRNSTTVKGKWDAFGRTAMNLSHAQNGANFVFNQIGEVGGAIAYTGTRALLHILPGLNDLVKAAIHGKDVAKAMRDAEYRMFGDTCENRIWSTGYESRVFKEASTLGSRLRYLDKLGKGINFASKLVTQVSPLHSMTDRMVRGARSDTLGDAIRWANGEEFSRFRNPFSDKKLKAANVTPELAENIKNDLNHYVVKDANGKPIDFHVEEWQHDNPETFFKFKTIIDNQAMRAIQQNTIGNKNVLKDTNTFTRMMFQFKDFTLKAINGQTLRSMTSREWDDGLAVMFSMASNLAIYALLTRLRADANFADDPAKHKEYLKERLDPKIMANAAFIRSAITGSFASFGQDAYDAYTGGMGYRTTVDRTKMFQGKSAKPANRTPSDIFGDYITQLPAMRAAKSVTWDPANAAYDAVAPGRRETKKDLHNLLNALPLKNFLPMVYISGKIVGDSHLPEKQPTLGGLK